MYRIDVILSRSAQILKKRPRIRGLSLLFPTLSNIADTPNGRKLWVRALLVQILRSMADRANSSAANLSTDCFDHPQPLVPTLSPGTDIPSQPPRTSSDSLPCPQSARHPIRSGAGSVRDADHLGRRPRVSRPAERQDLGILRQERRLGRGERGAEDRGCLECEKGGV